MTRDLDELRLLKDELADHIEELVEALLGPPTKRNAGEMRYGRKGSLCVYATGKNGPSFYSFEEDVGGSLLDLIVFVKHCSFDEAIEWAQCWVDENKDTAARPPRKNPVDAENSETQRIADARRMFGEAQPIKGTPAAKYLSDHRGIAADEWPNDVARYHPRLGVIFAATTADGTLNAVQRIEIEDDGKRRLDAEGKKLNKWTRGILANIAVRFPATGARGDGLLLLAEGPETAASCWWATGSETWATLGSIAKSPLASVPKSRVIVVCRDDDPADASSRKALRDAIRKWQLDGRTVVVATPWSLSRGDKSDFNDLLIASGRDAVRQRILHAIGDDEPPRPKKLSLDEAERATACAIKEAIDELVFSIDPPNKAVLS